MRHESRSLQPWTQFTSGVPAALAVPAGTRAIEEALAALIGCEAAILSPSTLHLFWDLFGILAKNAVAIYFDAGVYPISRWGVERAAAAGVPVRSFSHHDAAALCRQLQQDAQRYRLPLVVTDGFCPACGQLAPITAYLKSVRTLGGYLILDDTQALGILGHSPSSGAPYGQSGGGSLCWSNVSGPDILVVSSLAKGFGVPLAVLAGSEAMIRKFEARSETRVHCSPPSVAVLHAAEHALAENEVCGEELRLRLAKRVRHFRRQLVEGGLSVTGGLFPVQTLAPISGIDTAQLYERLLRHHVRTVLRRSHFGSGPRISFIITALHSPTDIDQAVNMLVQAAGLKSRR